LPVIPAKAGIQVHNACMTRLLTALLALLSCAALAQDYPNKPIRLVVPYAPGGSSDVLGRTLGQKLTESLGQQIVVDNRPGAGSMVGTEVVAKSAPDGYTLVLSDMPHTINPSINPKVPYHPVNDFAPVSVIGVSPMFFFAHAAFEAKSVKELIAMAKAKPGAIAIASGGNGATTHLLAELLQANAGIKLNHVPYKGAGPAAADVAAGQVPITFTSMATAAPFFKANRLRILGVTSAKRLAAFPDVPTFEELGLPGLTFEHWWGVMAPAKTPQPVVARLNAEIAKALAAPDLRERFIALAVEPRTNSPEDFRALIQSDLARWAKVVRDAGIKVE
jgi:tripartite-type tricarboxylate transporter receptor subunit TctC